MIGDKEASLCDCFLCDKEMLLDDGVTGNKNLNLKGSEIMEDP